MEIFGSWEELPEWKQVLYGLLLYLGAILGMFVIVGILYLIGMALPDASFEPTSDMYYR